MNPCEHVIYKLRNAQINQYPFPHFFVRDVFPHEFYWAIIDRLPPERDYKNNGDNYGYNGRKFADSHTEIDCSFMDSSLFARNVMAVFQPWVSQRFKEQVKIRAETRLIMDGKGYSIGPHTDATWKCVSLLFYLPRDYTNTELGTSLYMPHERGLKCEGGPHYKFDGFDQFYTAPYIPNSCFGFWKTDNSWHGVPPIEKEVRRDVLLYNIYEQKNPGE